MYVNFGQPISAREYFGFNLNRFEHAQVPAHIQQLSKRELDLVNKLGRHVSANSLVSLLGFVNKSENIGRIVGNFMKS